MTSLSPHDLALARHSSYTLLSRLLLEGVSAELHPYLDALSDLPPYTADADQAAAEHQTLLGFNLFPNESIFLDTSGLLGGELAERVQRHYQQNGYGATVGTPDHIGHQLGYLAFLCGAEADAWEDNRGDIVIEVHNRQRDFLQSHLLRWLPPFVAALSQQDNRFYAAVGELVWSLVASQADGLLAEDARPDALPDAPDLLGSDETTLRRIAEFLTMPALSGWWLGQDALGEIGRNLDLPRGFGGRVQTLLNTFRSATQYDAASPLVVALNAAAQRWLAAYDELEGADTFVDLWRTRLSQTVQVLDQMHAQLNEMLANEAA